MRRISKDTTADAFEAAKPQLTSLVDVLTVLLIFLIHSFSAEASDISPVNGVTLAESSSRKMARDMASIEITPKDLQVNGMHVATLVSVKNSGSSLNIDKLYDVITREKLFSDNKEVMIQADKSIEFEVVKKVMFTCSNAGASDYTVLVVNAE